MINADTLFIAGDDALNGSNMFAYCNGNPVMRVDPSGRDSAFELFVTVVNGFITAAPQIFSFIKLVTIDFGGWFFEQDWTWVGDIYKGLGSAFDSLFANDIVQPIIDSFGLLRGLVNTVFDDFIPGVRDLIFSIDFDAIGKNIQGAVNAISNVVTPLWNGFLDWIRNIGKKDDAEKPDNTVNPDNPSRVFEIDGSGYMMVSKNETKGMSGAQTQGMLNGGVSAPMYSSGNVIFQLGTKAKIEYAYLFYNPSSGWEGLKSVELCAYAPGADYRIRYEWEVKEASTSFQTGVINYYNASTNTFTATSGIGLATVKAKAYKVDGYGTPWPSEEYVGSTEGVWIVSIDMEPDFYEDSLLSGTMAGRLPHFDVVGYENIEFANTGSAYVIGYYGNYDFIQASSSSPNTGTVAAFTNPVRKGVLLSAAENKNHQKRVDFRNAANKRDKFVQVAYSQVGYWSGTQSGNYVNFTKNYGLSGWTKYRAPYSSSGTNGTGAWCAAFVSWCADQAGLSGKFERGTDASINMYKNGANSGTPYKTDDVADGGHYFVKDEKNPRSGDLIYFIWTAKPGETQDIHASHIGIVYDYDPVTTEVIYIDGNGTTPNSLTDGGPVYLSRRRTDSQSIKGYFRPNFDL